MSESEKDMLFKTMLKCKRDQRAFGIGILGGIAVVECVRDDNQVLIRAFYDGADEVKKWCGLPVAACNRLIAMGADYDSINLWGEDDE